MRRLLPLLCLLLGALTARADDAPLQRPRPQPTSPLVFKAQIQPHWFADNTRFWYRNDLSGERREFVLVDVAKGQRTPAFDHKKLAAALSKAAEKAYEAEKLPFNAIEFVNDNKAVRFQVGGSAWECDLATYVCTKSTRATRIDETPQREPVVASEALWPDGLFPDAEQQVVLQQQPRPDERSVRSPDRKWTALIKDENVYLRGADDKEIALTRDGKTGLGYGMLAWSPDSKAVVTFKIEPGERKEVHLIRSSPREGGRAQLMSRPYALPGDKFTSYELALFDAATQKPIEVKVDKIDFGRPNLRWHRDGQHFTYQQVDRGHQRFRLVEVDAHTGKTRNLIDEKATTFVWTAHGSGIFVQHLDKTDEIVYGCERDGWFHLYLIDAKKGAVVNQITKGEWRVRNVERIDETNRQIWFSASGKNAGQDPYLLHHYRVDLDGKNFVALTEGDGTHTISYSPDRKYIIDTYGRADLAPVNELRRVADGKLVCALEKADIADLLKSGWEAPEVFTAKGRDGKTDIWGMVCKPNDFDPKKKYPVIEYIYAGPHSAHVPKAFSPFRRFRALTDLGFVVVQMDGMGTALRSKAFHDVCWHNLKDAGFPDRILWHQAVAKKYPWYDISRVGIYGTSAGGQNSTGALLFHPDFYKAAVSACGCHDNRMDKASWNEQWMGYPVGPHYADNSNITHAAKLQGKLLLIVGELDTNVPPESTLRLVDALIKANKDFDLLVMPGLDHSDGREYGQRRLQDFFVKHLQGIEPPNRNREK